MIDRTDHICFYVGETKVRECTLLWQQIVMNIIIGLCDMPSPRFYATDMFCMQRCFGYDYNNVKKDLNDKRDPKTDPDSSGTHVNGKLDTIPEESEKSISCRHDLYKCINIFLNMFPTEDRPTCAEEEILMYCLSPILDQMYTYQILIENQVSAVSSVSTGDAN